MIPAITPLVTAAIDLDELSLQHRVDMTAEEATAFLDSADSHLEILPEMVLAAIPKDSKWEPCFSIGKEYSRVIYVRLGGRYMGLAPAISAAMSTFEPDEIEITKDNSIRLWWD